MTAPKVSVIMPAYNAAGTIAQSIESVLRQTFSDWELVIVNDASKDSTLEAIARYQSDSRIRVVNLEKNGGLPNARNVAVANSCGEFIAFLDSDDIWNESKLQVQLAFHESYPEYQASHTDFEAFDEERTYKRPWKSVMGSKAFKNGNLLPTIYYKNEIAVMSVMMKKKLFDEIKGFDPALWTLEDQDLWIRLAEHGCRFGYINKVMVRYRISPNSISRTTGKYKKAYKAMYAKYEEIMQRAGVSRLAWGNYYRHFGTCYYKKQEHRLANMYFLKSIKRHGLSFISLTTLLYMAYNTLSGLRKNEQSG